MQNKRTAISAGELYVLLDREFRSRQPQQCSSCYVLLPYRVDRRDGSANWEVIMPPSCPVGCAHVLEELIEEYSGVYDLAQETARN